MWNRGRPGTPSKAKSASGSKGGNLAPRRHPRHLAKSKARCPLGEVLDLSAGGMRIACKGKPPLRPGRAATISVRTSAGEESLNVRCCWVKRADLLGRKHEIGLKFIGITDVQAQRLGVIAEYGFIPEDQQPKKRQPTTSAAASDSAGGPEASSEGAASGEDGTLPAAQVDLELAEYYDTLELTPTATAAMVREAYRRLVRTCHPDVCDSDEARDRFLAIQQAYDILRLRKQNRAA